MHLVIGYSYVDHPRLQLILECKKLLARTWLCTVTYLPRNANKCADLIAKLGHNATQLEVVWFEVAPPSPLLYFRDVFK